MASKLGRQGLGIQTLKTAACAAVLNVLISPLAPLSAQDFSSLGTGELTATSYEAFDDTTPMAIELLDDSEINIRLADDVREALTSAGRTVDQHSDLILYVSTVITGRDGNRKSGSLLRLYGDAEQGVDFSVNIYSDKTDSLLTGSKQTKPGRVAYRFIGEVRRGPEVLWQGRVETQDSLGDTYQTFKPMVQTLVDGLGKTEVPEEPIN